MALLPGYEYDIFISYRHNDNLDGWVSGFVEALEKELKATIKEPVSIYFDKNPHDGLLETHHVDKSLEGKLKCLIFIPIISQTYCDEKSFAWQHEFVAFNKLAKEDELGREIKLSNSNVASRILPVKIHDLDASDKAIFENELGGALRAIEFIYKEPGVNRPLKPTDTRADNQNKTDYRNQVNKVANAVKEIVNALKNPQSPATTNHHRPSNQPSSSKKKIWVALTAVILLATAYFFYQQRTTTAQPPALDKSIAVLPFTNMTNDSTQNYFTDGMADDILNHLSKIADLRVKSRTSTLQYRNTSKTMPQIAEELGAGTILEGSVRKVGNQVRIVVQLIDARNDVHIWSETYDRPLEDVLKLQSEIAMAVSSKLKVILTSSEATRINASATANLEAYDLYLKAKALEGIFMLDRENHKEVKRLLKEAIRLDPNFAKAYAALSSAVLYDPGNRRQIVDSARMLASRAVELDPTSAEAHFALHRVLRNANKLREAFNELILAHQLNPNNSEIMWTMGHYQMREGHYDEGARLHMRSLVLQKNYSNAEFLMLLGLQYQAAGEYDRAVELYRQAAVLQPESIGPTFQLASFYFETRAYHEARRELLKLKPGPDVDAITSLLFADSYFYQRDYKMADSIYSAFIENQKLEEEFNAVPAFHRLGYIKFISNEKQEGLRLLEESVRLNKKEIASSQGTSFWNEAYYRYSLSASLAFLGKKEESLRYLDSALVAYSTEIEIDPLFDGLRKDPDFQKIYQKYQRKEELTKQAVKRALRQFEAGTL